MSLVLTSLALSTAVLSGGARLVAAGGGLPQRITTSANKIFGTPGDNTGIFKDMTHGSCGLDSAAERFLFADLYSWNRIVCFNADGSVQWDHNYGPENYPETGASSVCVDPVLREVYAGMFFTGLVRVYDADTGAYKRSWDTGYNTPTICFDGVDSIFVGSYNSGQPTLGRFDRNGNLLGTLPWNNLFVGDISANATTVFATAWNGESYAVARSNGAITTLPITAVTGSGVTGVYKNARNVVPCGNKLYRLAERGPWIDELSALPPYAPIRRVVYPGDLDGQIPLYENFGSIFMVGMAVNADWIVFRNDKFSFKAISRKTQRARFVGSVFANDQTLKLISIPGFSDFCKSATFDDSRSIAYLSLDDGVTRTPFTPGTPMHDLPILAGQRPTIDVDMNLFASPVGIAPYIGGDSGEGIVMVTDDPSATNYVALQTARLSGSILPPPVLSGRITVL